MHTGRSQSTQRAEGESQSAPSLLSDRETYWYRSDAQLPPSRNFSNEREVEKKDDMRRKILSPETSLACSTNRDADDWPNKRKKARETEGSHIRGLPVYPRHVEVSSVHLST